VLEQVNGGIVIAGHLLPQNPTLRVMTQHELTFAHHMEAMMSDVPTSEHRQLLVELLCIVATLMERNPEIYFSDSLDCDKLIDRAFELFRQHNGLPADTSPEIFFNVDQNAEPSGFLIQAVVEKLLSKFDPKSRAAAFSGGGDAIGDMLFKRRQSDDLCHVS